MIIFNICMKNLTRRDICALRSGMRIPCLFRRMPINSMKNISGSSRDFPPVLLLLAVWVVARVILSISLPGLWLVIATGIVCAGAAVLLYAGDVVVDDPAGRVEEVTRIQETSSMDNEDTAEKPFTCPHCRHRSEDFHNVCPECGRPFMRDYIDWRMHPRDLELRGTLYYNAFWARMLLVLTALGLVMTVLVVVA